jgi:ABC-type enterochelin transport system permease subunit
MPPTEANSAPFAYDGLDRVIHERVRLAIVSALAGTALALSVERRVASSSKWQIPIIGLVTNLLSKKINMLPLQFSNSSMGKLFIVR